MKLNAFATATVVVLALMVLATAALALSYVRYIKQLQILEVQTSAINQNVNIAQALAADAVEYSQRNPAMKKVLDSVGIKVNTPSQSSAKTPR